jgi:hypothetical protein
MMLCFWFLPKVKLRGKSCHVGGGILFQSASLAQYKTAYQSVLHEHQDNMHRIAGFEFFLLPSKVHARPSATARRASPRPRGQQTGLTQAVETVEKVTFQKLFLKSGTETLKSI